MGLLTNKKLAVIFAAAATIGVVHYAITGLSNALTSCYVALYAGWGALAFDIFTALQSRRPGSSGGKPGKGPGGDVGRVGGP